MVGKIGEIGIRFHQACCCAVVTLFLLSGAMGYVRIYSMTYEYDSST